jgi:hypothetical protein
MKYVRITGARGQRCKARRPLLAAAIGAQHLLQSAAALASREQLLVRTYQPHAVLRRGDPRGRGAGRAVEVQRRLGGREVVTMQRVGARSWPADRLPRVCCFCKAAAAAYATC